MNIVYLSSFTGASNPRNDGVSVFTVTNSTHLVHKMNDLHFVILEQIEYEYY